MRGVKTWKCQECGKKEFKWVGVCSVCKKWNTFVEEKLQTAKLPTYGEPKPILAISPTELPRVFSGMSEFDRLVGGGVVPGAFLLLGGTPGIGKSTLLLQLAHLYAEKGEKVLYVSGEESEKQVSLRGKRIGAFSKNLYVLSETSYEKIAGSIRRLRPTFLCIDSVQILHKEDISSPAGSVLQVKELASCFLQLAKKENITCFLVGHVTKTGDLAGPRLLEHLVDTVLEFEGDKSCGFRMLRCRKNRFGSTDDLAVFHMQEEGLKEVKNPSKVFLEEKKKDVTGSAVTAALEGGRAFLVEMQALVSRSFLPSPTRKSSGIDQNRLSLILAVLEKKMGYKMHASDVFASVTGGLKVKEPASDLAVLCAVASSFKQRKLPSTLFLGEVGLCGDVRSCSRIETRLKEAELLGFVKAIIPRKNLQSLPKSFTNNMELIGVDLVEQALQIMDH